MGKRRVKQQNISVIGLFKLAGRHEKMDDVFVYHECQSTRWSHSTKNKNKQTQSKQRLPRAFYHVCSFFYMPFLYILPTCSFFHVRFLYVLSTSSFFHLPFLYVLSSWLFVTLFVFWVPFPYVLSTCVFVCFAKAFPIRSV